MSLLYHTLVLSIVFLFAPVLSRIVLVSEVLPTVISTANTGDTFELERGLHYINTPIFVSQNITITGVPGSEIVCTAGIIGISANTYCTISGITLINCTTGIKATAEINLSHTTFINNNLGLDFSYPRAWAATSCTFQSCVSAVKVVSWSGLNPVYRLVDSWVENCGSVATGIGSIEVHNVTVTGGGVAFSTGIARAFGSTFYGMTSLTQGSQAISVDKCHIHSVPSCFVPGSNVSITRSTFFNITGPVVDRPTSLDISESTFTSNVGVVLSLTNPCTVRNSLFQNNRNGAINMEGGASLIIDHSEFIGNTISGSGAAISSTSTSYILGNNITCRGNIATGDGGCIHAQGSYVNIVSSRIQFNRAGGYGGGIHVDSQSNTFDMYGTTVTDNYANFGGGLHLGNVNSLTITGSVFSNNQAHKDGGGMSITDSRYLSFFANTVSNNTADQNGGGLFLLSCTPLRIEASNITDNKAFAQGGGLHVSASYPALLYKNKITGNKAANQSLIFRLPIKDANETVFIIRDTTMQSYDSTFESYCCSNASTNLPNGLCNFPMCQSNRCPGAQGCNCPFSLPLDPEEFDFVPMAVCPSCTTLFEGPFCNIAVKDNCNTTTCPGHTCTGTLDSYVCSCGPAFTGIYPSCTYKPVDCSTNNGGCDWHVKCENGKCGSCPPGFTGDGYTGCEAQCGNSVCEPLLKEDCVSCPADCLAAAPCDLCGDGFCNAFIGEDCKTCSEDCGLCEPTKCKGCSVEHGSCVDGVCVCKGNWGGPNCDKENDDFDVDFPPQGGGVVLSAGGIGFTLSVKEIREINTNSVVETSMPIKDLNFSSHLVNVTTNITSPTPLHCTDCGQLDYIRVAGHNISSNSLWQNEIKLPNTAILELVIWKFTNLTTVYFAKTVTNYTTNTLKLGIQIKNWPFKSSRNVLEIVLASSTNSTNPCPTEDVNEDEKNNLKWSVDSESGVGLYGQFLNQAVLDGVVRTINFTKQSDGVIIRIPHFWYNSVLDPSYSVLVSSDNQGISTCADRDNGNSIPIALIIVAVLVPITVIVGLVALIVWVPQIRTKMAVCGAIKAMKVVPSKVELSTAGKV